MHCNNLRRGEREEETRDEATDEQQSERARERERAAERKRDVILKITVYTEITSERDRAT